jgi:hypothetical protein
MNFTQAAASEAVHVLLRRVGGGYAFYYQDLSDCLVARPLLRPYRQLSPTPAMVA